MAKKRKTVKRTARKHSESLSPIMQFGVVFVFVAAIALVAIVAKLYL